MKCDDCVKEAECYFIGYGTCFCADCILKMNAGSGRWMITEKALEWAKAVEASRKTQ